MKRRRRRRRRGVKERFFPVMEPKLAFTIGPAKGKAVGKEMEERD